MTDNNLEYVPSLTLEPDMSMNLPDAGDAVPSLSVAVQKEEKLAPLDMENLSEAEKAAVVEFSDKIDINDTNLVLQYGSAAQKHIADFSGTALDNVRTKDMGEVGDVLSGLVVQLRGFDYSAEEKKGIKGLFKKASNQIAAMKVQYDKAEANVDKIVVELEKHQLTLLKDIAVLDKLYGMNLSYFRELTMYILAGKRKLQSARENELPEYEKKAKASGLPEDAQAANDFANKINRFEKKLHDLELTRIVSIQMAPQIRLIQNNDSLMVEKIQSSIVNTIPLWKSQMVLALGLHHSQQAMEAQRAVTDVTNELLRKNAEALKIGSIEVAKESERGIVDIETLKMTNERLIETLDEVRRIQQDGSQKRREAETELGRIEGELKQKLLELRG